MELETKEPKRIELIERHAKWILPLIVLIMLFVQMSINSKIEYNPVVSFYTTSGKINQPTRVWDGIVTVTTATAQSVDISSAGFTNINSVTITPANNSASTTSMPIVSIKSYTNSAVVFNTLVSNSGVVGLLVALVAPSTVTGMQVHVRVDGW